MSEATQTVAVEQDPFNGQEPTFEEFSEFRKSGTVPERFKPAEQPPAATPEGEAKPAEEKGASEAEQEKQKADENGKVKAKDDKEPLFTPDQQKAFDKAFARREAKLRREYDERIAALESQKSQGAAPAKEPTKEAASSEPQAPELPDITTFQGTAEEFQKALKEYPAKFAAYLDAKRQAEESQKSLQKRLADSEKRVKQDHPDFQEQFDTLVSDVESGTEPALPPYILKSIAEDAEDPHALTYHLAMNRDEYRRLAELPANQAVKEVLKLEFKLQQAKAAPAQEPKPRQTSAPPPPEPVATRSAAKGFDVTDETLSADEWAKKRNEQVFKRR